MSLFDSLGTTEALAAIFSDDALLAAMGRFEAALVRAQAKAGIVPPNAAEIIGRAAEAGQFDAAVISGAARASGTIAIPFVEMLTARVAAAGCGGCDLRPLGNDQPGRERHRDRAVPSRGCAGHRR